jgi:hypothetical protein
VFCAVLAWCRVRFVRFADNEGADTTLAVLAECFEVLGGVPGVVLADRMGWLKGWVVANKVVFRLLSSAGGRQSNSCRSEGGKTFEGARSSC